MENKGIRPAVWIAVIGSLGALVLVLSLLSGRRQAAPEPPSAPAADETPPGELASRPRTAHDDRSSSRPKTPLATPEQPEYIEGMVWGELDLREAKALMPDNLYWKWGAPTKDEALLEEREKEKARRNEEYGRVLAGDATEDEVRAYYDYKKKLSTDYLEFAEFMGRRYRNSDNKSFVGMLDLATKMHAEKLALLPGELEDALERAREHAKIREDWRRQQEEFGAANPPADGNDTPQ